MTKVERIEENVKALSAEELVEFRSWFAEYDSDLWDEQIEADLKAGKLNVLREEALAAHLRGESKPL